MRVEVLGGLERRRPWSQDDKARIVEETLAPGAKVTEDYARAAICTCSGPDPARLGHRPLRGSRTSARVLPPLDEAKALQPSWSLSPGKSSPANNPCAASAAERSRGTAARLVWRLLRCSLFAVRSQYGSNAVAVCSRLYTAVRVVPSDGFNALGNLGNGRPAAASGPLDRSPRPPYRKHAGDPVIALGVLGSTVISALQPTATFRELASGWYAERRTSMLTVRRQTTVAQRRSGRLLH